ncbi:uncharacterized protein LOC114575273 [Exaiptasia diaphana]|uniref:EGF-like domain-containing protein n=1 Tax=Exaiptasia diaphana TaxID=2652724 RepID=A0A913YMB3_EXADI|nr:uncharacterized protein LOC114575273 [Exaiptasia diaphana]
MKNIARILDSTIFDSESILNLCQLVPCQNGGSCIYDSETNKRSCTCKKAYTGENCEVGPIGGLENSAILVNTDNNSYAAALAGFLDPALKPFGPGTWIRCFRAVPGHWDTRMYFHPQCDGKKPTVTIIRVRLSIFGGFTDKAWHSGSAYSESTKST